MWIIVTYTKCCLYIWRTYLNNATKWKFISTTDLVSGFRFPPGPPRWYLWPCQGHHNLAETRCCNTAPIPTYVTTPSYPPAKKVIRSRSCQREFPTISNWSTCMSEKLTANLKIRFSFMSSNVPRGFLATNSVLENLYSCFY